MLTNLTSMSGWTSLHSAKVNMTAFVSATLSIVHPLPVGSGRSWTPFPSKWSLTLPPALISMAAVLVLPPTGFSSSSPSTKIEGPGLGHSVGGLGGSGSFDTHLFASHESAQHRRKSSKTADIHDGRSGPLTWHRASELS